MSKAIGFFYGTTTGKTEQVAEIIRDKFGGYLVTLHEFYSVGNDYFTDEYASLIVNNSASV